MTRGKNKQELPAKLSLFKKEPTFNERPLLKRAAFHKDKKRERKCLHKMDSVDDDDEKKLKMHAAFWDILGSNNDSENRKSKKNKGKRQQNKDKKKVDGNSLALEELMDATLPRRLTNQQREIIQMPDFQDVDIEGDEIYEKTDRFHDEEPVPTGKGNVTSGYDDEDGNNGGGREFTEADYRRFAIFRIVCCWLFMIIIIVGGVMLGKEEEEEGKAISNKIPKPLKPSIPSNPVTSIQPTSPPVSSPTNGGTGTAGDTAFTSLPELREAVEQYLYDDSPNTIVATKYGYPIGNWDVSQMTTLKELFRFDNVVGRTRRKRRNLQQHPHLINFDVDISLWDVRNVEDFTDMFHGATNFQTSDLSKWNTSSAKYVTGMFRGALSFENDLSNWVSSR